MSGGYQGEMVKEIVEEPIQKPKAYYIFIEYGAKVIFRYKKKYMYELTSLNDFYGKLTCVKEAIKDARSYAKLFEIFQDSEARIEVVLETYEVKKEKTGRKLTWSWRKDEDEYRTVGYPNIIETKIIWSTAWPEEAKEDMRKYIEELKNAKATVPEPEDGEKC